MQELKVKVKDEAEAAEVAKAWAEIENCIGQLTIADIDKEVDPGQFYTVVPHDGGEVFHLDVSKAHRLVKANHAAFYQTKVPLTDDLVSGVLSEGGIETDEVDRLPSDFKWDVPALGFYWSKGGNVLGFQLFDGSHRAVKAAQRGDKEIPVALCSLEFAKEQLKFRFKNENINKVMGLVAKHNFEFRGPLREAKEKGLL